MRLAAALTLTLALTGCMYTYAKEELVRRLDLETNPAVEWSAPRHNPNDNDGLFRDNGDAGPGGFVRDIDWGAERHQSSSHSSKGMHVSCLNVVVVVKDCTKGEVSDVLCILASFHFLFRSQERQGPEICQRTNVVQG